MFAPPLAETETKADASWNHKLAHERSASVAQRFGGGVVEQAHLLQRTGGNQATLRFLSQLAGPDQANLSQAKSPLAVSPVPGIIQPKLEVGAVDGPLEREADRVAPQVMSMQAKFFETSNEPVQRQPKTEAGADVETQVSLSKGRGSSLPDPVRAYMEPRFGMDFSHVHVHTGSDALQMNQAVGARAFTHGSDIYFGAGHSPTNLALTAHELTHVVQQTGGVPLRPEAKRAATPAHGEDVAVIRGSNRLQSKLIQRDGPHKAEDVTQEETEALINFKNDWENNFSHYHQLITISGRSYNKDQKEGIKAVKHGSSISITLGKPYFTESDEQIRWQWIKKEVIDKNVKTDKFEDIAYDPTHSKINEIAPPYAAGQYCALNCPATAASLDDYFRTGNVSPAICNPSKEGTAGYGFDISKNTFLRSVSWKRAEATIKNQLKKHGDFVIVEATRSEKQMKDNNVAKNHYFAVVNVKGHLFAMDAFGGGIINDNIQDYIDNRVNAVTYRIVKGEFKVKEVIPK